jgi:serine/threonine protein phosphatase PrpC
MAVKVTVCSAAGSSVGLVRENNEDSAYAGRWMCAVADGLGGHVGGEVASAAVIGSLRPWDAEVPEADLAAALGRAISEANDRLRRIVEGDPGLEGMGTTLTALLWSGARTALGHVGDSRAYLLRDGSLSQISEDHTLANAVADPEAAGWLASMLVRFLGGQPDQEPDIWLLELFPGDRFLLCSDGLSGVVADEVIRDVLGSEADPSAVVGQLIDRATDAGGPDNITVVIADVAEAGVAGAGGEPEPEPVTVGAAAGEEPAT